MLHGEESLDGVHLLVEADISQPLALGSQSTGRHPLGVLVELGLVDRFINIADGLEEVFLGQGLLDLCLQLLDVIFVLGKLHDIDLAFFDLLEKFDLLIIYSVQCFGS